MGELRQKAFSAGRHCVQGASRLLRVQRLRFLARRHSSPECGVVTMPLQRRQYDSQDETEIERRTRARVPLAALEQVQR